jgi:hypothetical protein
MSDELVAETSAWQHDTLTTDKYPCPRWDSKPQSSASERPQTYVLDRSATGSGNINSITVTPVVIVDRTGRAVCHPNTGLLGSILAAVEGGGGA